MEKLWKELKKIESNAEHIHSETLKKSEGLVSIAKQHAENLLSVSKKYIEAEVNELLNEYREEAAKERNAAFRKNEKTIKELGKNVKKRFDKAVNTIFDAVLGKIKV